MSPAAKPARKTAATKKTSPKASAERARRNALASLGSRVREARLDAGWTQQDLANAVGAHRVEVSKIETGDREPGAIRLALIARELDVSLDWLLH